MSSTSRANNPTSYMGVIPVNPGNIVIKSGVHGRAPLPSDCLNYNLGDIWVWMEANAVWMLTRKTSIPAPGTRQLATWTPLSGAGVAGIQTIQGNFGAAIGGAAVFIVGDGPLLSGITSASIAADTLEFSIQDAQADGVTKGVSTYNPAYFTSVAGYISLIGTPFFFWLPAAGAAQILTPNRGYYTTAAGVTAFDMPAVAPVNTVIRLQGASAGGWTVSKAAGQTIIFTNAVATSAGAGVRITSTEITDGLEMVCITADTTWQVLSIKGNPLVS